MDITFAVNWLWEAELCATTTDIYLVILELTWLCLIQSSFNGKRLMIQLINLFILEIRVRHNHVSSNKMACMTAILEMPSSKSHLYGIF